MLSAANLNKTLLKPGASHPKDAEVKIPYMFPNIALGHRVDFDPLSIKPGFSIRTYDVNLDTIGAAKQRRGIRYIAENGACGTLIANFGEAGWTNATLEEAHSGTAGLSTGSTLILDATANDPPYNVDDVYVGRTIRITSGVAIGEERVITSYDESENRITVNAWGTQPSDNPTYTIDPLARRYGQDKVEEKAQRITHAGASSIDSILDLTATPLDLEDDQIYDWIVFWVYVPDVTKLTNILFAVSTGDASFTNQYAITVLASALSNGWNYVARQKKDFTEAGTGVWSDVQAVLVRSVSNAATYTIFDNAWLGPERINGAFNFRRSAASGGGNFLFAAARGRIDVLVPEEFRWKPLVTGLDRDAIVTFAALRDFLYACNGVDATKLILDDSTFYDAGMPTPIGQNAEGGFDVTIENSGGSVQSGFHEVAVRFYSTITGYESDPLFSGEFYVATANSKLTYSNLPVTGPTGKETHLRIYRRAPLEAGYRRTSEELEGEVALGTATFVDTLANSGLGALMDGSPNYDTNGQPPVCTIMAVVKNHLITDDVDAPGRLRVSKRDTGEQFPLDGIVALDEGDNDVFKGIASVFGRVGAFKQDSCYIGVHVGGGRQPFAFRKEVEDIGTTSHRSIIVRQGLVRWRHTTGWWEMDPSWAPRKITAGWDEQSALPLAEPTIKDFDNSRSEFTTAAFLTSRDQIYWTAENKNIRVSALQAVLHEPLQRESGWSFHRAPVHLLIPARDRQTHNETIYGAGDAGIFYALDQNNVDDMTPAGDVLVDADYATPPLDMQEASFGVGPDVLKNYSYIAMLMRPSGVWPMDFETYYDYGTTPTDSGQLSVGTEPGPGFGTGFTFGVSAFGRTGGVWGQSRLSMGRHRSVVVRFRNPRLGQAGYIAPFIMWVKKLRDSAKVE